MPLDIDTEIEFDLEDLQYDIEQSRATDRWNDAPDNVKDIFHELEWNIIDGEFPDRQLVPHYKRATQTVRDYYRQINPDGLIQFHSCGAIPEPFMRGLMHSQSTYSPHWSRKALLNSKPCWSN